MTITAPVTAEASESAPSERWINRRVAIIWALVFFNVIEVGGKTIVPIPHTVSRVLTQLALAPALWLAYAVNRRLTFRPNMFLAVVMSLSLGALLISMEFGTFHSQLRGVRWLLLVLILWLLTPWWGRRDFMIARIHLQCLAAVLVSVVVGFLISPGSALFQGRLAGRIWPIPPTQVAHYAAVSAGVCGVMFLTDVFSRRLNGFLFVTSVAILLFTHTRTATIAMGVAFAVALLSLVRSHVRARHALIAILIAAALIGGFLRPQITAWATRGENTTQVQQLSGRTRVWVGLENAPRTRTQILFGTGLTNGSFNGRPIDSSWLSLYEELGLFGDVLGGLMLLVLVLLAVRRPRGPARAIALFLIVYCAIASYTETGLGLPSPYLLDLSVAAALVAPSWSAAREAARAAAASATATATAVRRGPRLRVAPPRLGRSL